METVVNGLRVRYIDEGEGEPVLLLHGWGAPAETYRLIIDHLSAYRRVIAPDLPGFGGSEEPPEAWNVDAFVAFVKAFAAQLGLTRVTLIGHSNGGRMVIKLTADPACPFAVDRAILMDAAGIVPKRPLSYYVKVYSYKAAKKVCGLPPMKTLFPHAVEQAQKRFGSADYQAASPVMRQSMVMAVNEDLTALLPQVRVPTLLIWGDKDTATPLADGQKMEKLIPDAGLVTLAGGGHFAFADRWGQCARVLDAFLKKPN